MSTHLKLNITEIIRVNIYLNFLHTDVTSINISPFKITQMPDLSRFTNLRELFCQHNPNLTSIVSLPNTLTKLFINSNINLKSLPPLPDNLQELYCRDCSLTTLPPLPNTLKILDCSNNSMLSTIKLTSLPNLPDTLEKLICYHNELTHLPPLPAALEFIFCQYNKLNYFPPLNDNIELYCRNNPIYERIGRITDKDPKSSDEYDYDDEYYLNLYTDISKFKKIIRFQEGYYLSKYKQKFRQWLLRTKEKEIIAKYKPENLFALLEEIEDEDYQQILDAW